VTKENGEKEKYNFIELATINEVNDTNIVV
jgi:hypothetical protein